MANFIIAYLLLLLNVPSLSDNILIRYVPLLYTMAIYFHYRMVITIEPFWKNKSLNKLLLCLIIVLLVGAIRNNSPNTTMLSSVNKVILLYFFAYNVLNFANYLKSRLNKSLTEIFFIINIVPVFLYIMLNVFLWFFSIRVKSTAEELQIGSAVILSSLGISMERVAFPLAPGINSYGAVVGGVLTYLLVFYLNSRAHRMFVIISVGCTVLTLLLTDTRSSFLYAPLIALLITLMIRINFNPKGWMLKIVPFFPVVGPFILILILGLLAQSSYGHLVTRSSEDLSTGNSRLLVWVASLNNFLDFKSIHLIGQGEFGHYISGVSHEWAFLFSAWNEPELTHPHNTILMMLFDYGYLGLALFIGYQIAVCSKIILMWKTEKIVAGCMLAFLIYFNIISITESFFGFYYQNSLYLFFSVTLFSFFAKQNS